MAEVLVYLLFGAATCLVLSITLRSRPNQSVGYAAFAFCLLAWPAVWILSVRDAARKRGGR